MADRKKTPDILGSLLGDTSKTEYHNTGMPEYHNDSKPELQPTSKPVRKSTGKTVSKPTSKPVSHKKAEPQEPAEKVKATYYLDAEVVEALEEGWMELRKLADKKDRGQISKSLIVELALQIALEELEKTGQNSRLAKKIL
jgi:uncharacterized protein (DUF4415 family)